MTATPQEFHDGNADMAAVPGNQNAHGLAPREELHFAGLDLGRNSEG